MAERSAEIKAPRPAITASCLLSDQAATRERTA